MADKGDDEHDKGMENEHAGEKMLNHKMTSKPFKRPRVDWLLVAFNPKHPHFPIKIVAAFRVISDIVQITMAIFGLYSGRLAP